MNVSVKDPLKNCLQLFLYLELQCLFLQSLVLKCQGQTEESLNVLVKSLAIANKLNQRLVEEIEELTCQFLKILVPPINPSKSSKYFIYTLKVVEILQAPSLEIYKLRHTCFKSK